SPNFTSSESESDRGKGGRVEKIAWPAYDPVHQRYLMIGIKPKLRDHYHAHRLSVWTQLIPKLHRSGGADVPRSHHLLEDFDDPSSYDGVVREVPSPTPSPSPTTSLTHSTVDSNTAHGVSVGGVSGAGGLLTTSGGRGRMAHDAAGEGRGGVTTPGDPNQTDSQAMAMPQATYSTALGVTIAVGCSLLILNVLILPASTTRETRAGRQTRAKRDPSR
ncbi:hypothetical protein HPB47_011953, partial [Ixodes persulcatus]